MAVYQKIMRLQIATNTMSKISWRNLMLQNCHLTRSSIL